MMTAKSVLLANTLDIEMILNYARLARQSRKEQKEIANVITQIKQDGTAPKHARMAVGNFLLGDYAAAKTAAQEDNTNHISLMILGLIDEASEQYASALKYYQKAAERSPSVSSCQLMQVSVLRKMGEVEKALNMLEKNRREFADKATFWYLEARCREDIGEEQEALDLYVKALELDPKHAEAAFHAGRLADLRGLDEEAKKFYERIGPDSEQLHCNALLNLALLHEDNGDYEIAIRYCDIVLDNDPTNTRAKLFRQSAASSITMYYSPEKMKQSERLEAILRVPISDFELSVRSRNCLQKMNIFTLGDLVRRTESEMLTYKNFGETSLREIREILSSRGLRLGLFREEPGPRIRPKAQTKDKEALLSKNISVLELSVRSRKCMESLGIVTIGDLCSHSEENLVRARNFGRVSLNEIKKKLIEFGLSLNNSYAE